MHSKSHMQNYRTTCHFFTPPISLDNGNSFNLRNAGMNISSLCRMALFYYVSLIQQIVIVEAVNIWDMGSRDLMWWQDAMEQSLLNLSWSVCQSVYENVYRWAFRFWKTTTFRRWKQAVLNRSILGLCKHWYSKLSQYFFMIVYGYFNFFCLCAWNIYWLEK